MSYKPKQWTQKDELEERLLNTILIPPSGPKDAKIMMIGDMPRKSDAMKREPLVGYLGWLLTECCQAAKINRYTCKITTVLKHKPYRDNFNLYYSDARQLVPTKALELLWSILAEEINELNPHVIVCLGRNALYAVCRLSSISKYRGSILQSKLITGYKVLVALHPHALQLQYEMKTLLELDLTKAKRESQYPDIRLPVRHFITNPTLQEIRAYFDKIIEVGETAIDIETDYKNTKLIDCIGFSYDKSSAICIPFFRMGKHIQEKLYANPREDCINIWSVEEEALIWKWITEIIENPMIKKIAQNGLFDFSYLARERGIIVKNFWHDTMLGHHNCYAEMPKGLDFIVSIYTDEPYFKGEVKENRWVYNCKDNATTKECKDEIEIEMDDLKVRKGFKFDMLMIEPLMYLQLQGLRINTKLRSELIQKYKSIYGFDIYQSKTKKIHIEGTQERKLWDKLGFELNVNSNKQMVKYLYEDRGFKMQHNRKTGAVTADKKALMKLYYQNGDEMMKEIIQMRQGKDFLSDYLLARLDKRTGNLHCGFNWTESFRLTSSESPFDSGRNLQNIPKNDARKMVIPNPGMEMGAGDLARVEAHIVAFLVKDEMILKLIADGGDIHAHRASMIYNINLNEVTKKERDPSKAGVHAVHYDVGAETFLDIVNKGLDTPMSLQEGKTLFKLIKDKIPTAERYQVFIVNLLKETRTLWSLLGRRRTFYSRWDKQMFREAYAWIPQTTTSDITNQGLQKVYYNYRKYVNILMQIHDEILFEYKPENRRIAHEIVHEAMTVPLYYQSRTMTVGVEHSCGDNWLELEEHKI